jgi:hypothetical protein
MQSKMTTILALLMLPMLLLAQSRWQEANPPIIDRGEGGSAAARVAPQTAQKGAAAPILIGKTWNAYAPQSPYTNLIAYDPFSNLAALVKRSDRTGAGSGRIVYHTSKDDGQTWSSQIGPINSANFLNGRHPNVLISNPTKSSDTTAATVVANYNDLTSSSTFGDVIYASAKQSAPGAPGFFGRDADDAFAYAGAVDLNNGNCYFAITGANSFYSAISRLTNGGTTLAPHVVIAPGNQIITQSGAAVDVGNDGTVHYVTRARFSQGAPTLATFLWRYQRSTDGGATWSAPEHVNPNLVSGRHASNYEFDVIVDGNNQFHIAALLVDTLASDVDLYDIVRSTTGTWSAAKVADIRRPVFAAIPQEPGGSQLIQLSEPEYAKTKDGKILALKWIDIIPNPANPAEESTPDVWLASSASGSWSPPGNVSNSPAIAEAFTNLATYMSDNGQLFMFYLTPSVGDLSECSLWFLPEAKIRTTAVSEKPQSAPDDFALHQNYPNPFNPSTNVSFSLPFAGAVKLQVFDVLGNEVAVLLDGRLEAGTHEVTFTPKKLPSGIYFYRLQAGHQSLMKKMVVME